MRICIVVPYYAPYVGGNENGLAATLGRMGHDVTIIASAGKSRREYVHAYADTAPYRVVRVPTISDLFEVPLAVGVKKMVKTGSYDIAMIQEDYQPMCYSAAKGAVDSGTPYSLSVERYYYPRGLRGIAMRMVDATMGRYVRDHATVYTSHSRMAASFAKRSLGVEKKIDVVPVGVDTEKFKPMDTEPTCDILTVARPHAYKGLDTLMMAVGLIAMKRSLRVRLLGPRGKDYSILASGVGVDDMVELYDYVPNAEMPSVYSSCRVYVQPSKIEPFGIAALEAMSCGKPVVASRVGGLADTIVDGETGVLVHSCRPLELADAIVGLLDDDEKRERMGRAGRKRCLEHYDWSVVAKRYLSLFP